MNPEQAAAGAYQRGIARNRGQFLLQTSQVFFVGLVIGMERTVLPSLAHNFGVTKGAFLFLASFVISFGLLKGALNLVAGTLPIASGARSPSSAAFFCCLRAW